MKTIYGTLSIIAAAMSLSSCAVLRSKTVSYDASTGSPKEMTRVSVFTVFDSQSALTKFRNTTGQTGNGSNVWSYPSGTTIGNLNQESSSTNLNELIGIIVQGAVQGAAKAVKP